MNDRILDSDSIIEFQKLIRNANDLNENLSCYAILMKELLIKSYCEN